MAKVTIIVDLKTVANVVKVRIKMRIKKRVPKPKVKPLMLERGQEKVGSPIAGIAKASVTYHVIAHLRGI